MQISWHMRLPDMSLQENSETSKENRMANNTSYSAKVRIVSGGTGNLKAYATLIINDLLAIEGFKVLESKGGQTFVGVPQHKGQDKEGKETWYNDVRWNEDVEEGQFRGPNAEAAVNAILEEYGRTLAASAPQRAGQAQSRRAEPDNSRPKAPARTGKSSSKMDW
jgi:DNA-binding cell septation regulator SpoVG